MIPNAVVAAATAAADEDGRIVFDKTPPSRPPRLLMLESPADPIGLCIVIVSHSQLQNESLQIKSNEYEYEYEYE